MKAGWWDVPLTLQDFAVSTLHATYKPIAIPITPQPPAPASRPPLPLPCKKENRLGYTLITHLPVANFLSLNHSQYVGG